jgi:hypothetical protein
MRLLFIILFFIPSILNAQYSIDRVYYDVNNSDTLYIKAGTDSLFRKVGENYEYAMKTWFKEFVQPTNVIGGSTNPHWDSIQGKPATFAPSIHSHAISGVTDLQTTLDGKLAANGDGSLLIGLTKSQVGLANVDNTSDANKPVSSATQTALNLKANLASPTFTGTVSGITAAMVGLGNVNNTSDAAKPISTATQTALDGKQALDADLTTWAGVAPGANVGTFLATPSSANLRGALTDESGTGVAYFQGGDLGTPSAAVLTNATSIPAGQLTGSVVTARLTNIKQAKAITIQSPTTSENVAMFYTTEAITITNVREALTGSSPSVTYVLRYGSSSRATSTNDIVSSHAATSTAGANATLTANVNIPAGSYIWIETSATGGTVNEINVTITYNQQ